MPMSESGYDICFGGPRTMLLLGERRVPENRMLAQAPSAANQLRGRGRYVLVGAPAKSLSKILRTGRFSMGLCVAVLKSLLCMPRSERKEEEARGVVFCGPPELDGVSRVGKVVFLGFLLLERKRKERSERIPRGILQPRT